MRARRAALTRTDSDTVKCSVKGGDGCCQIFHMQKESQVIYLVLFTVIGYCWMAWKCITIKSIENIKNRNKDQPIYGNYSLEWKDLRGGNTEQLRKTKPPKQNRMIPRFNLINPQPFTKTKYPWRYDFSKASKENFSQHTWKISIIKDLKMHNCYLVWSQVTNSRTDLPALTLQDWNQMRAFDNSQVSLSILRPTWVLPFVLK